MRYLGRLAQWLERPVYIREVVGSSPIPSIVKYKNPKVGVAVIIKKSGKILLIKRVGSHGSGTWAPPGGHIDFGESIINCAKRETREEVGIKIKNLKVIGFTEDFFKKEKKHYITIWVDSKWKSGKPKVGNDEMTEIGWFALKNLPKPLFLCFENFIRGGLSKIGRR